MRLLVAGFGPFPRVPRNPSEALARRIAASPRLRRVLGQAPRLLVMRTAYDAIPDELEPALAERPDAVLMVGVATRARRIRVESLARNRASRLFPDASGRAAARLTLDPAGPARRTSPAAREVLMRLHRVGAVASRDAGRYLCNASYFRALAEGCPAIFLHIPPLPVRSPSDASGARRRRQPIEAWSEAFVEAAILLLVRARNRQAGQRVRAAPAGTP